MIKNLRKIIACGALLAFALGMVNTASAGPVEITIYGASAQYKYWTSVAYGLMKHNGCNDQDIYIYKGDDVCDGATSGARDAGFAVCAGTDPVGTDNVTGAGSSEFNGQTLIFKYASFASAQGIYAVQGQNPDNVDPECVGNDYYRLILSPNTYALNGTDWETVGGENIVDNASLANCECQEIKLGASDVEAECFNDKSHGQLKGPFGGDWSDFEISDLTAPVPPLALYKPVIVPFRFFANCDPQAPVPFTDISSIMGRLIFTGTVANWNKFRPDLDGDGTLEPDVLYNGTTSGGDSLPLIQCVRHAGSGTQATTRGCIVRSPSPDTERPLTNMLVQWNIASAVFFNKGSSDMMRCIGGWKENAKAPKYENDENPIIEGHVVDNYRAGIGAIGYADADKLDTITTNTGSCLGSPAKYGHIHECFFDGVEPIVANVANCRYGCYWSPQHIYARYSEYTGDEQSFIDNLIDYASDPVNMPANRANYWVAGSDMKCCKDSCTDQDPIWCP
ncbi:MAG: hypothetical protein JJV98_19050 [Desulfosarcina sp.]|nr:hypothetical protein [Desulfobacterales bacterium]